MWISIQWNLRNGMSHGMASTSGVAPGNEYKFMATSVERVRKGETKAQTKQRKTL